MTSLRIRIERFTPNHDESPRAQDYDVPIDGTISVLQAIRRIHRTLDGTLSFRNCDCRRGVCGISRCHRSPGGTGGGADSHPGGIHAISKHRGDFGGNRTDADCRHTVEGGTPDGH